MRMVLRFILWMGGCLVVLVGALVFWALAPQLFFRCVAWAGTLVMLLSVAVMVLTCRRAKRVTALSQFVPIIVSTVTACIYVALLRAPVATGQLLGFAIVGGLAGAASGLGGHFLKSDGQVRMSGTAWHVIVWGCVLALNQCVVVFVGHEPVAMLLPLVLLTGFTVGRCGMTLLRYIRFRSGAGAMWCGARGAG